jgi:hypothetical protein
MTRILAGILLILSSVASAQPFPQTMPPDSVVGRLGPPTSGPGSAVTMASLQARLLAGERPVADANFLMVATDRVIAYTSISAARTVTLPSASLIAAGTRIMIFDRSGSVSAVNTISVAPSGADTLNGAGTPLVAVQSPRGMVEVETDGISKWTALQLGGSVSSVSNSDGSLTVAPTTGAVVGSINLGHANTWTAVQQFNAATYFQSGSPWADVKAFGALGNNSNDDTTAIRNAITQVGTTGGVVNFPPGAYKITGTLTIPSGVILRGINITATSIFATSADFTAIAYTANDSGSGLERLSVFCIQSLTATTPCVTIGANAFINMHDFRIWGGLHGIQTAGADGYYENGYVCGWATAGYCISSTGANWYSRMKLDGINGGSSAGAFIQGTVAALAENHFSLTDFSGSFTNSIVITDANSLSLTVIQGSVFSSPILIGQSKATILTGNEIGSTSLAASGGPLIMAGNYAFSATTASGTSVRTCAGNANVTC